MKTIVKISALLMLALFVQQIEASDIDRIELIVQEKGVFSVLSKHSSSLDLSQEEMNYYVSTNRGMLQTDIQEMINLAFRNYTTDEALNTFLASLDSKYMQHMKEYKTWLEKNTLPKVEEQHHHHSGNGATNCANVGFNSGTFNNWKVELGLRYECEATQDDIDLVCFDFKPSTYAIASAPNMVNPNDGMRLELISSSTVAYDPFVGGQELKTSFDQGGSGYSIRLENKLNGYGSTKISYDFVVDANKPFFQYNFAAVLEDPGNSHPTEKKPFFMVQLFKANGEEIDCARQFIVADDSDPDFTNYFKELPNKPSTGFKFCDWQTKTQILHKYVNQTLTAVFTVSDCPWGGHLGYAYVDASCFDGAFTVEDCEPGGSREISYTDGFDKYHWGGNQIIGANDESSVQVNGTKFKLKLSTEACDVELPLLLDDCTQPTPPSCQINLTSVVPGPCNGENEFDVTGDITSSLSNYSGTYHILLTDGIRQQVYENVDGQNLTFTWENLYADGIVHTVTAYLFTDYFFEEDAALCQTSFTYTAPDPCLVLEDDCNCIASFAPLRVDDMVHGKLESGQYIVSGWLQEEGALPTQISYDDAYIKINFYATDPNNGSPPVLASSPAAFKASGLIIEKWQRVQEEFTIPAGANFIEVELHTASGSAFFDDIRIYPVDGNMQSYVYDPVSLKLVATLDENNYATLYEYDFEGNLVRVKKETERGIITIKENRQSTIKQN